MNISLSAALCAVIAFLISAVSGPILIPILRKLKFGQQILEIGPKWHESKNGTPTMGGIIFIAAIFITGLFFIRDLRGFLVLIFSILCGGIGFLDDYIKVVKKRNKGLSPMGKIILMLIVTITFSAVALALNMIQTSIAIPFTSLRLEISYFIIPVLVFIMIGFINSVNLTDGVDGLASSVTFVVALFFTLISMIFISNGQAHFSAALAGGLCGFMIYNLHPAKVFMGDTGSLFLGGAVVSLAILNDMPLILIVVGIIYLVEAVSVMLQVTFFKLTKGKRLFKMAPIHHHFEMSGMSENKIVVLFSFITFVTCLISFLFYMP